MIHFSCLVLFIKCISMNCFPHYSSRNTIRIMIELDPLGGKQINKKMDDDE